MEKLGHKIVARNFKTKFCEIDVVSVARDKIYFTEVKTRRDDTRGGGIGAIDKKKLDRMKFAAEGFLQRQKQYCDLNPLLAVADVDGGTFVVKDWMLLV